MAEKLTASESVKQEKYTAPEMERHEPVKIVQLTGGDCSLYYTNLYYSYYY
jgi:hypothetical protein